jgi:hypothetical protein
MLGATKSISGRTMKRAVYEWGAILASSLAVLCPVYWVVSIGGVVGGFGWNVGNRTQISAIGGTITMCNDYKNWIGQIEQGIGSFKFKRHSATMPGIRFRWVKLDDSMGFEEAPIPVWSVEFSLLIPMIFLALIAGVCLRRYRRIRAAIAAAGSPRPTVADPVSHPLD